MMSILVIPNSTAFLYINEIMYNPDGKDNNREYIEIFTDLNLENFTIQDLKEEDTLKLVKKFGSNYSLIVEEGFNYTKINATIYSIGKTIGNNLNNDGDIIIIKNNSNIFDTVHYYSSWGANNNGNSLCLINNNWRECFFTPGKNNEIQEEEYNIKINEFLPDPVGNDNSPMPDGEWIELINLGTKIDLENFYFKDSFNHKLFITQINTHSTIIKDYLVVYVNGFSGLLNNEDTEKIQLFDRKNNLIDEVSYSFSKEGLSWSKIEDNWIQTVPSPNKENVYNKKEFNSKIEIEKIYLGKDNKAKFGDNIRVKLDIYKGDTNKESVSIWIEKNEEKISKKTRFNVENKFEETSLTVPIQIFPNCNGKFEEGEYTMKIEGIDTSDKKQIIMEGITKNLCGTSTISLKEKNTKIYSETNINDPDSTINDIIYESTSNKAKNLAIYFFCFVLIFVIIQLATEKWKR